MMVPEPSVHTAVHVSVIDAVAVNDICQESARVVYVGENVVGAGVGKVEGAAEGVSVGVAEGGCVGVFVGLAVGCKVG